MAHDRLTPVRRSFRRVRPAAGSNILLGLVREGDGVLILGLDDLPDDAWAVLTDSLHARRLLAVVRANEALLRSLVDNIPGALYRCACDFDWTMEWLSDEIEEITGYPASDFIGSKVRTFASIEHPDDHEYVARSVMESVETGRPLALEAADRARRDIERNLHDGAQQRLAGVALELNVWLATHRDLPEEVRAPVSSALEELRSGLAELRDLARGLHPAVLSDHGLEHALRALAQRAAVPVELQVSLPEQRLPMAVEAAAYFAVSEALTNVARYAQASHASVRADECDGQLNVTIDDDGVGGAALGAGSGLQGLRDRLAALDGTLVIEDRTGGGTRLRAELPCREAPAAAA